jgi:uncharacterized protein YodC (DUF2158 family)
MERVYRQGDVVLAKRTGHEMVVMEDLGSLFFFRYRCWWTDKNGDAMCDIFCADWLVPVREND